MGGLWAGEGALLELEVRSLGEWRDWLAANHAQPESIWLVSWKARRRDLYIPYRDLVTEAIAWGWIDSLPRALDDDRSMRRMSPRKAGSAWSRVNKAIAEDLIAQGRMQPPGLYGVRQAQESGAWSRLDDVEAGLIPDDLARALEDAPEARAWFEARSRSDRRAILEWILAARTARTRARRIDETASGRPSVLWRR